VGVEIKKPTPLDARSYVNAHGRFDFASFQRMEKIAKWKEFEGGGPLVVDFSGVDSIDPWLLNAIETRLALLLKNNVDVAIVCDSRTSTKISAIKSLRASFTFFSSKDELPIPEPKPAQQGYGTSQDHKAPPRTSIEKEKTMKPEDAVWLIRKKNGKIYGYFSSDQLKAFFKEGRLAADDLLSKDKKGPWLPAEEHPFLQETMPVSRDKASDSPTLDPSPTGIYLLTVAEGSDAGREFLLREGPTTLGRGSEADLGFLDKLMSRTHCKIMKKGDLVLISDLGSTNGTFVNEAKIETKELQDGDRIRVGGTVLTYSVR